MQGNASSLFGDAAQSPKMKTEDKNQTHVYD